MRPIDPARLVVLDEAGANLAMGRSHAWVRRRLAPRLRRGDVVLLDNLKAHKAPEVRRLVEARGALLRYLPPYSHDLSPIEPAWGLAKRDLRKHAPRPGAALRRVARRARHVVRAKHCRQWFAHTRLDTSTEVISGINQSCPAGNLLGPTL